MLDPVFVVFFPGAGGKVLINCLHLSCGVLFNDLEWKGARIDRILATIPNTASHLSWFDHEIHNAVKGCDQVATQPRAMCLPAELQHQSGKLPLVAHWKSNLECYQQQLGAGTVIKLTPDLDWLDLALRLKWQQFVIGEPGFNSDVYELWQQDTKGIKCDLNLIDYNPLADNFLDDMAKVFDLLRVTPDLESISRYLDRYREYHVNSGNAKP